MNAEETLQRIPLFRGLQPKQVKSLARWTTTRNYPAGTAIVREGQPGLGLYFIESGTVKVTQQTANGERELRTMGPGQSFGELSLLEDRPRTATITAMEPTTCVLLDKMQFNAELRAHPEMAIPLLHVLAGWLLEAEQREPAQAQG
ncbi:MAG TPA: cyclic nucleotide-binding domain-containing protein [Chloroflexota bacterium]|nr:cyclic nucleotide-binding domain-containing protein [Chloroflexota bacterium]